MAVPALLLAAALAGKSMPVVKPAGNPKQWFTAADYPVDALLERQQGVVGFELKIDPTGRPTACRVYRSSGMKLLDEQTCTLAMQRASFKPPRQVKKIKRKRRERGEVIVRRIGPPVPAIFRHAVRWRLPNVNGTTDQTFVVRSDIAPDGTVTRCTMTGPGALGSNGSCGLFGSRTYLATMIGPDYRSTAMTEIKLELTLSGATPPRGLRSPDAYYLLAEAAVTFDSAGRMRGCEGMKALRSARRSTDLCELLKAQPPKIMAGMSDRRAVYTLDLSAIFR